jgi:hypothetical protein
MKINYSKAIIHSVILIITGCMLAFFFSCCGCSLESDVTDGMGGFEGRKTGDSIKIINWNLQTFFDGTTDGNEYSEFQSSNSSWDTDHYKKRLEQLCSFIVVHDADVYVFEEIENVGILQDISNSLPALNCGKNPWIYACFGTDDSSSLGCAVLSRYALSGLTLHQLDYRVAYCFSKLSAISSKDEYYDGLVMDPPSMRPLLEVHVCAGCGLQLFVCHWKSKSGDEDGDTIIWRQLQERLLTETIKSLEDSSILYLVCGDFNQCLYEFDEQGGVLQSTSVCETKILLHSIDSEITVYSPWNLTSAEGSYYYNDTWEKIDHFFYNPLLKVDSFMPLTLGDHVENGIPMSYDIWADKGWSDHLPIVCWVSLK